MKPGEGQASGGLMSQVPEPPYLQGVSTGQLCRLLEVLSSLHGHR